MAASVPKISAPSVIVPAHIPTSPARHTTMVFHCTSICFTLMRVPMWGSCR